MKNFWLDKHKKRVEEKKLELINKVVRSVIQRRLGIIIGSVPPWRKNAIKTQP